MFDTVVPRVKRTVRKYVGPRLAARQPERVDLPHSLWGLSVGPNGTLWSGDADLQQLAREQCTPVHVLQADALDRNARQALAPAMAGEGADVFYSYKTHPVPAVLQRLHGHGIGAEVISPYELWLAMRLGVPAERIIYNGPAKSDASLRIAIREGIYLINANTLGELEHLACLATEQRRRPRIGVRVALPGFWAGQFGVSSDAPALFDTVRRMAASTSVDLCGLHFHRGGSMRTVEELDGYVSSILEFIDELRVRTGWQPSVLDIGGSLACPSVEGFPGRSYRMNRAFGTDLLPPNPGACLKLGDASRRSVAAIRDHCRAAGLEPPLVVQEPGRALTGNTQLLLTTVVDVKDDGNLPHAVLDAGINIAEPVLSEYHQIFSVTAPQAPAERSYRLVGPICTPGDVIYNNWRLPELRPGHVLAIMDTGAYFVPFSTSFSFPRPSIVVQDADGIAVARRRESFEDLVGNDVDLWADA